MKLNEFLRLAAKQRSSILYTVASFGFFWITLSLVIVDVWDWAIPLISGKLVVNGYALNGFPDVILNALLPENSPTTYAKRFAGGVFVGLFTSAFHIAFPNRGLRSPMEISLILILLILVLWRAGGSPFEPADEGLGPTAFIVTSLLQLIAAIMIPTLVCWLIVQPIWAKYTKL